MSSTSEAEVVESAGNEFELFVQARWGRLVRSAVLLGADVHSAEDLVQSTLARCHLKWDKVAAAGDVDAYVHRVLINVLKAARRRRWTGEVPYSTLPEPVRGDETSRVHQQRALLAALARLPEGQRQAVVLRHYADCTEAQTAAVLGVAIGTVKSRCARAIATLAQDPALLDEQETQ